MLKAGDAEALLVVKLDRLTRSVVDLGSLVERYFAPGKAALPRCGRFCANRVSRMTVAGIDRIGREEGLLPTIGPSPLR